MPSIIAIFSNPLVIRAIIALILMSILAATAGTFSVFRGYSFLIVGVAHASLAGATLAILLEQYGVVQIDPTLSALLFGLAMAVFVSISSEEYVESTETAIGVAFAFSMSLALLFISLMKEYSIEAWGLILGDILLLTPQDIMLLTIITVVVAFLFVIFMREFIFISFDPEGTKALGVNVKLYNLLFMSLVASATVVMLRGVGAILVYVILIMPAATANRILKDVTKIMLASFIISIITSLVGLTIALFINAAPSAIIGLISVIIYAVIANITSKK